MKAIGQAHDPTALALVDLQNDGGLSGRVFAWRLHDEKVWSHMRDADGFAVDDQLHLHLGRMCSVILFRYHERNTAS